MRVLVYVPSEECDPKNSPVKFDKTVEIETFLNPNITPANALQYFNTLVKLMHGVSKGEYDQNELTNTLREVLNPDIVDLLINDNDVEITMCMPSSKNTQQMKFFQLLFASANTDKIKFINSLKSLENDNEGK